MRLVSERVQQVRVDETLVRAAHQLHFPVGFFTPAAAATVNQRQLLLSSLLFAVMGKANTGLDGQTTIGYKKKGKIRKSLKNSLGVCIRRHYHARA